MAGHIKIDRKILNWEWYSDVNMFHLFLYFLLKANWKDGKFKGNLIKRGQLVTGRLKISKDTGLSEMQIRTCLNKLKSTNEITSKVTNRFTIVTICKYDFYQNQSDDSNQQSNQQLNQQITNKQPTDNQQVTTIEEFNKEYNKNKVFNTKPFPENFNGLPEIKIGAAIEFVRITKQATLSTDDVKDIWAVFKIQNLTGKKFYEDEDAVYSHFLNWIKKQDYTNGKPIKQSTSTSVGARQQAGAEQLLNSIKQDFAARGK